jgi:hypothetical protein
MGMYHNERTESVYIWIYLAKVEGSMIRQVLTTCRYIQPASYLLIFCYFKALRNYYKGKLKFKLHAFAAYIPDHQNHHALPQLSDNRQACGLVPNVSGISG